MRRKGKKWLEGCPCCGSAQRLRSGFVVCRDERCGHVMGTSGLGASDPRCVSYFSYIGGSRIRARSADDQLPPRPTSEPQPSQELDLGD